MPVSKVTLDRGSVLSNCLLQQSDTCCAGNKEKDKVVWCHAFELKSYRDSGKVIAIPYRKMFRCTMRHEPIASD